MVLGCRSCRTFARCVHATSRKAHLTLAQKSSPQVGLG